jgi:hypothetical protein
MAELTIRTLNATQQTAVRKESSRTRQAAKKAGVVIPTSQLALPQVEQEETDIS